MDNYNEKFTQITEEFVDRLRDLKREMEQTADKIENKMKDMVEVFDFQSLTQQLGNPSVAADTSIFDGIIKAFSEVSAEDRDNLVGLFHEATQGGLTIPPELFASAYYIEMGIRYERDRQAKQTNRASLTERVLV